MPHITFKLGDLFEYPGGVGMVISLHENALMIEGGGRKGFSVKSDWMPSNASILTSVLSSEQALALKAAACVLSLPPPLIKEVS